MKIDPHTDLNELSEFVRKKIGIYFSPKNHSELYLKLSESAREMGYANIDKYIAFLQEQDDRELVEKLASRLTVGETYFLRNRELFSALEEKILPDLIERKRSTNRTIRIWSAASASGEEAYSIAMLLDRILDNSREWNIHILATDINHQALTKAKQAVYTEWSFRSAPSWLKEQYFTSSGEKRYQLIERIRKMVDFRYLNLVRDEYPSLSNGTNAMDLILCRNVLIYFSLEDIVRVTDDIYNCLVEDGLLITTPTESFQHISNRFSVEYRDNCVVYLKHKPQLPEPGEYSEKPVANDKSYAPTMQPGARRRRPQKQPELRKPRVVNSEKSTKIPDNLYGQAKELYRIGNYEQALDLLNRSGKDSLLTDHLLLKARIFANQGRLNDAEMICRKIHEKDKLNAEAYYIHAMIKQDRSDVEASIKFLRNALFLDPEMVIANYTMGVFSINQNDHSAAIRHFRNTMDLLKSMDPASEVPEADGIKAGRLAEIIQSTLDHELKEKYNE